MNKSKILKILGIAILPLFLANCNEQVPAGHKGKILGKTGFQPEIYPPSKVWLTESFPRGLSTTSEKMFLMQTTTKMYREPVEVLLKDKLTLRADVRFRGRITTNEKIMNSIFNDMPMDDNIVTTDEVYQTYGRMVIRNTSREVISKYNVDEVNQNYARITTELYQAIKPKLIGLPIEISDITLGNIEYPTIVTAAIENAKERRMQIEKEEAQVQIELTKKHGQEELAEADYRIKMMEAKRIRDYNRMIVDGITPQLLKLRTLELREKELDKWNGILPTTFMGGSDIPVIVNTTK